MLFGILLSSSGRTILNFLQNTKSVRLIVMLHNATKKMEKILESGAKDNVNFRGKDNLMIKDKFDWKR